MLQVHANEAIYPVTVATAYKQGVDKSYTCPSMTFHAEVFPVMKPSPEMKEK
jgi:hypothetical protein